MKTKRETKIRKPKAQTAFVVLKKISSFSENDLTNQAGIATSGGHRGQDQHEEEEEEEEDGSHVGRRRRRGRRGSLICGCPGPPPLPPGRRGSGRVLPPMDARRPPPTPPTPSWIPPGGISLLGEAQDSHFRAPGTLGREWGMGVGGLVGAVKRGASISRGGRGQVWRNITSALVLTAFKLFFAILPLCKKNYRFLSTKVMNIIRQEPNYFFRTLVI